MTYPCLIPYEKPFRYLLAAILLVGCGQMSVEVRMQPAPEATVAVSSEPLSACAALPAPLYANYQFDEAEGPLALDASGYSQPALLVNGAVRVADGLGQAVELDGSDDYLSLPSGIVGELTDFTIAAWVKLDTVNDWQRIFDFGNDRRVYMFLTPKNFYTKVVRFGISVGGNSSQAEQRIDGSAALPINAWTHVAVTLSGNVGTLYVNGAQEGQNTNLTLNPARLGRTTNNWIGQSQFPDPHLNGRIDDFRIYQCALNPAEIQSLFNSAGPLATLSPTSTPQPPQTAIVWYKFDETDGATAIDSSGNNQHALLINGPSWVAGQRGGAVDLDGVDDYVSLPGGVVSQLTDFTIATWVKLDTISNWQRIFDFGDNTIVYMFLTPKNPSTDVVQFGITTGGKGQAEQQIDGAAPLPVEAWTHVAVTLSGKVGTLYINGVQEGQNTDLTLNPASLRRTVKNWIGQSQFPDPYLDGQIDDFRIYNRALSAAEILALFQSS